MGVQKNLRPRVERVTLQANPEAAERRSGLHTKAGQVVLGIRARGKTEPRRLNGEKWLKFF
jgi:hypothetical protein